MLFLRYMALAVGAFIVLGTFGSAVRTVVIPRAIPARIGRVVFLLMRALFRFRARPSMAYDKRDRIMTLYAPVSLMVLLATWLALLLVGFAGIFWAVRGGSIAEAFTVSGSSLLTLGFARPVASAAMAVGFVEAAIGLVMVALLIAYLPAIYGVFSRRESLVAAMEVRAGSPPSGVEILQRAWRVDHLEMLTFLWDRAENWFLEIQETHGSFPAVVFFRSPLPDHSWVTASGALLDAGALLLSSVDRPFDPRAAYCIRAGYLSLRRIAKFFRIPFDPDPRPDDPIAVTREEFDDACESLAEQGLPIKADRERAWRDFSGWRVNYDRVVIALAGLTMAPVAPWSSDRSVRDWRPRASIRELRRA
ncbi:MAG: hypothetical protein ACRDH8_12290 [Actinomycetota bacterium]|jgi:hypothetical protein